MNFKKAARVSLLAFVVTIGCTTKTQTQESNTSPKPVDKRNVTRHSKLPIIDVHTHTTFDGTVDEASQVTYSLDGYKDSLAKAGVVASVSHGARDKFEKQNFDGLEVIQCYGLGFDINYKDLEKALKNKDARCVKVYLGYIFREAGDEAYRKAYRLAEKYKVPVVFHTGDTYAKNGKLKYADPLTIDEVAVDFPNVTFVIAHLGNPWIQSAAEVAYKNDNVYVEGSALLIGDFSAMPQDKIQNYVVQPLAWAFGYVENPKKFMFGTDWPLSDISPYVEAYKLAIPKEYWCDVFYYNAIKVFGFSDKYECAP